MRRINISPVFDKITPKNEFYQNPHFGPFGSKYENNFPFKLGIFWTILDHFLDHVKLVKKMIFVQNFTFWGNIITNRGNIVSFFKVPEQHCLDQLHYRGGPDIMPDIMPAAKLSSSPRARSTSTTPQPTDAVENPLAPHTSEMQDNSTYSLALRNNITRFFYNRTQKLKKSQKNP